VAAVRRGGSPAWRAAGRLLAGLLVAAAGLVGVASPAQERPAAAPAAASRSKAKAPGTEGDWHARRGPYFQRNWGVDIVGVRRVSSGLMLRFDYRVVDADKASVLTDRKARPYVIDEATGIALAIPAMENIGELRQVAPLELARTYFMIFGNPGGLVKHGGRVTLVAGAFRVEGLEVE
jgi:hypothetical protein